VSGSLREALERAGGTSAAISIGFSKERGFLSWLIRKVTKAPCSHAFLILREDLTVFGKEMVIEASAFGVRMTSRERFTQRNTIVGVWGGPPSLNVGVKEAGAWLGEVYDYTGLFGMVLVLFGRWLKKKWANPIHAAHSMFCSELVAWVLKDSGYPGAEMLEPANCSPGDLYQFLGLG
jgi:hypothetical protein